MEAYLCVQTFSKSYDHCCLRRPPCHVHLHMYRWVTRLKRANFDLGIRQKRPACGVRICYLEPVSRGFYAFETWESVEGLLCAKHHELQRIGRRVFSFSGNCMSRRRAELHRWSLACAAGLARGRGTLGLTYETLSPSKAWTKAGIDSRKYVESLTRSGVSSADTN